MDLSELLKEFETARFRRALLDGGADIDPYVGFSSMLSIRFLVVRLGNTTERTFQYVTESLLSGENDEFSFETRFYFYTPGVTRRAQMDYLKFHKAFFVFLGVLDYSTVSDEEEFIGIARGFDRVVEDLSIKGLFYVKKILLLIDRDLPQFQRENLYIYSRSQLFDSKKLDEFMHYYYKEMCYSLSDKIAKKLQEIKKMKKKEFADSIAGLVPSNEAQAVRYKWMGDLNMLLGRYKDAERIYNNLSESKNSLNGRFKFLATAFEGYIHCTQIYRDKFSFFEVTSNLDLLSKYYYKYPVYVIETWLLMSSYHSMNYRQVLHDISSSDNQGEARADMRRKIHTALSRAMSNSNLLLFFSYSDVSASLPALGNESNFQILNWNLALIFQRFGYRRKAYTALCWLARRLKRDNPEIFRDIMMGIVDKYMVSRSVLGYPFTTQKVLFNDRERFEDAIYNGRHIVRYRHKIRTSMKPHETFAVDSLLQSTGILTAKERLLYLVVAVKYGISSPEQREELEGMMQRVSQQSSQMEFTKIPTPPTAVLDFPPIVYNAPVTSGIQFSYQDDNPFIYSPISVKKVQAGRSPARWAASDVCYYDVWFWNPYPVDITLRNCQLACKELGASEVFLSNQRIISIPASEGANPDPRKVLRFRFSFNFDEFNRDTELRLLGISYTLAGVPIALRLDIGRREIRTEKLAANTYHYLEVPRRILLYGKVKIPKFSITGGPHKRTYLQGEIMRFILHADRIGPRVSIFLSSTKDERCSKEISTTADGNGTLIIEDRAIPCLDQIVVRTKLSDEPGCSGHIKTVMFRVVEVFSIREVSTCDGLFLVTIDNNTDGSYRLVEKGLDVSPRGRVTIVFTSEEVRSLADEAFGLLDEDSIKSLIQSYRMTEKKERLTKTEEFLFLRRYSIQKGIQSLLGGIHWVETTRITRRRGTMAFELGKIPITAPALDRMILEGCVSIDVKKQGEGRLSVSIHMKRRDVWQRHGSDEFLAGRRLVASATAVGVEILEGYVRREIQLSKNVGTVLKYRVSLPPLGRHGMLSLVLRASGAPLEISRRVKI